MRGQFYFKRVRDQYLVTNDTGAYAFLNDRDFRALLDDRDDFTDETRERLKAGLFWTDESREGYLRRGEPALRDAQRYLLEGTSLFILAVTNACNLRCVYCQAHGTASARQMTLETAHRALLRIRDCPSRQLTIEFQGGEPLLNFDVIRYVVETAPSIMPDKAIAFTVVSNLLLLTDDMAAFFRRHHVSVSTSLDGPPALHDRNRPLPGGGSSSAGLCRGLERLRTHGIQPGAIQTTTRASLDCPEQIVETYAQLCFRQLFLRPLTRLGAAARHWDSVGYAPDEFLAFYRRALNEILRRSLRGEKLVEYQAALFLSKILNGRGVNYMELRSPCGAGLGQMAVNASGNVYTCDEGRMVAEMGDEAFLLGNVADSGYQDWIESPRCKAVCAASLLESLPCCCDCVYKPYCGVCPVVNYALCGNLAKNSGDRCRIYAGILDILFEYLQMGNPAVLNVFREWSDQV